MNLLDKMTAQELAEKTAKDIKKIREKRSKDIFGYYKETSIKNKKRYNVKYGGFRW